MIEFSLSLSHLWQVMVSTSGHQLLPEDAVKNLREKLLPMATILTPNIPEALLLLRNAGNDIQDPENVDDVIAIANAVKRLGPSYVLIKGGHIPFTKDHRKSKNLSDERFVVDVLVDGKEPMLLEMAYSESKNTHGTGCSLASAIAANLALGMTMPTSVRAACRYVEAGIKTGSDLGKGSGPINHFHSLQVLPFISFVPS